MSAQHPLVEVIAWFYGVFANIHQKSLVSLIKESPHVYYKWWEHLYREAPEHIFIETGLICFIVWLLFIRKTIDPNKPLKKKFTKDEVQWLVDTWTPDPLVPDTLTQVQRDLAQSTVVIDSVKGHTMTVQGIAKPVLHVSSYDFLGLSQDESVIEVSRTALDKYGCGSCGPRGFYGTIDQHLYFEQAIAKFMGAEEAICYSDSSSAVTSTIPAFSKKGDLLIIDDACSEAVLTGANLSRSTIQYFKHNDMQDLANIMQSVVEEDKRLRRDSTQQRRFVVIEGLYRNTGDVCNLPEIMALKKKYCYRLIVDESLSFGTLGKTGRGVTDLFGVDVKDIEMIVLAVDTVLTSVGGVCIGTREIVDHQRLSGAGYCFSASNPPFLSAAATQALKVLEGNPGLLKSLEDTSVTLFARLSALATAGLSMTVSKPSPIVHLYLTSPPDNKEQEAALITALSQECLRLGVAVATSKFALVRRTHLRPTLRVCASVLLTVDEIEKVVAAIRKAMQIVSKQ